MVAPVWDLESIYPGGPASTGFTDQLSGLARRTEEMITQVDALAPLTEATLDDWARAIVAVIALREDCRAALVFANCHSNADVRCRAARRAVAKASSLGSAAERSWVPLASGIACSSDASFQALKGHASLVDSVPRLCWIRANRHNLLPPNEAALAVELGKDGIHAWNRLYTRVAGTLMVTLPDGRQLSVGQAQNLIYGADAAQRQEAFEALLDGWTSVSETCAAALTHIVGTRLSMNRRRGVSMLSDTLARNRMSEDSLNAMLEATRRATPLLKRYLTAKADLLGKEQLAWEDQAAPVGELVATDWDRSVAFIEAHFRSFSPVLGDYLKRAISARWVEAEDRPNKQPGGWCASVSSPPGASRIFMTFGGTFRSTTTLAHELGHGYHNHVLRDTPPARRHVPSTLAETASVFAENIVRDAALDAAHSDQARLAMLDARLSSGVATLMNIPFRYHLEREMYAMRERGELDQDELMERTVAVQRDTYADALSSWHPLFWAEKLHFYISSFLVPFIVACHSFLPLVFFTPLPI